MLFARSCSLLQKQLIRNVVRSSQLSQCEKIAQWSENRNNSPSFKSSYQQVSEGDR